MEVCILGPLVVSRAGAEVHLGRSERVLLARLVLAAGHVVDDDALVDALWGGARRERARATLQGYVHRLRRAIGLDLVERRFDGYALAMQSCAVDVVELEAQVSAARRAQQVGDLDGAADLFGLALRASAASPTPTSTISRQRSPNGGDSRSCAATSSRRGSRSTSREPATAR